jgi:hypothetical protein
MVSGGAVWTAPGGNTFKLRGMMETPPNMFANRLLSSRISSGVSIPIVGNSIRGSAMKRSTLLLTGLFDRLGERWQLREEEPVMLVASVDGGGKAVRRDRLSALVGGALLDGAMVGSPSFAVGDGFRSCCERRGDDLRPV